MINVLSKVTLLNVNSTCAPPCLILYQHYVHNISTLPNTLPQYPASRGALAHQICHVLYFHANPPHWDRCDTASLTINICVWRWMVNITLRPLCPQGSIPAPTE